MLLSLCMHSHVINMLLACACTGIGATSSGLRLSRAECALPVATGTCGLVPPYARESIESNGYVSIQTRVAGCLHAAARPHTPQRTCPLRAWVREHARPRRQVRKALVPTAPLCTWPCADCATVSCSRLLLPPTAPTHLAGHGLGEHRLARACTPECNSSNAPD